MGRPGPRQQPWLPKPSTLIAACLLGFLIVGFWASFQDENDSPQALVSNDVTPHIQDLGQSEFKVGGNLELSIHCCKSCHVGRRGCHSPRGHTPSW